MKEGVTPRHAPPEQGFRNGGQAGGIKDSYRRDHKAIEPPREEAE